MPKMGYGMSNKMNQAVLQPLLEHHGEDFTGCWMPFELSPAPEEFQKRINVALEGLQG